ncbi:DUF5391 domain-containing protein [Bacillus aquiflavi]|uniref:DUF5391 domain-containing protein n=1 Tax=Bacillus aquiflavi TaxID=2672567 RepID=UPI00215DA938|nr:DUF5391 domain-containing protein [Bacillus aquiflavi]
MILTFYIVPLFMYIAGLKWMKYIMAIFCALGIIIFISFMFITVFIGTVKNLIPMLVTVLIICCVATIMNIIWFFIMFRSKDHQSSVHTN